MSVELVLLLSIYAFILLGAFLGDQGPIATFRKAGPRLAARIERNIATGTEFTDKKTGGRIPKWEKPDRE